MSEEFTALSSVLNARFSCRAFLLGPVPEETIQQIIRTAGQSPSWCNAQPWKVTVTKGDETARFAAALQGAVKTTAPAPDLPWPDGYTGAHQKRRRSCGYQLYEAVGIARGDHAARAAQSMRNFQFFDAPHVAIIHSGAELGPYGAMDCGGFVTAFMLAATALGVGTIAQASVAAYPNLIRTHFELPEDRLILCAISFGYGDPDHPANGFRTARAELGDIYDPRGAPP